MTPTRRKIHPYQSARINRFCRLCRPLRDTFDLEDMRELGQSMEPTDSRKLLLSNSRMSVPPGPKQPAVAYTYFGQFIDHDLTLDNTELANAGKREPFRTVNAAGGRLELHHIYGDGPRSKRHGRLYMKDGASFRLGDVLAHGEAFDLPLDKCGCPMSADKRNTDNLILRQICVLFMKLHNVAVQELKEKKKMKAKSLFRDARKRVIEQYQWLVRNDFLKNILCKSVFTTLNSENLQIRWRKDRFAIPVEFAQAAFRFGHSMVRDRYKLNRIEFDVPLTMIFGHQQRQAALSPEKAIDWKNFVVNNARPAMLIDTLLTPTLFKLPSEQVCHFSLPKARSVQPAALSVRTLQRGARTRLPTGQQVARAFCVPPLKRSLRSIKEKHDPWAKLEALDLLDRIPLWYYVLLEAEVEQKGYRLGVLGSRLISEVILGSLRSDRESFINQHHEGWQPKPWTVGNRRVAITTLASVALVTRLIK